MKKRLLSIFLVLLMVAAVLPGAAFAEENVSIHVCCASGQSTELSYPLSTKLSQVKEQIAREFGISFEENEYWLYCSAAGKAGNNYNYRMDKIADPALSDYFTEGQVQLGNTDVSKWLDTVNHRAFLKGYEDGTFRPQEHISRAEVAAIVCRMLERSADQEYVDRNSGALTQFKDISKDHWAYYAVMEAASTHGYTRSGDAEHWN